MSRHPNDGLSRERRVHLRNLAKAEAYLRNNLHLHGVDAKARPHMERALAHVREASMAVEQLAHVRSVSDLIRDCETGERLIENIRKMPTDRDRGIRITP